MLPARLDVTRLLLNYSYGLGRVSLKRGRLGDALDYFRDAERLFNAILNDKEDQPERPLHSMPGVLYSELLIDMATDAEKNQLLERADKMLEFTDFPLMADLHHLNKARILVEREEFNEAMFEVQVALDGIKKKHKIQFDCQPLLLRASIWRRIQQFGRAADDLKEVVQLSQECTMPLYEADAQIMIGNIAIDEDKMKEAGEAYERAFDLITNKIRYELRLAELWLLVARLQSKKKQGIARLSLRDAKNRIDKLKLERLRKPYDEVELEIHNTFSGQP